MDTIRACLQNEFGLSDSAFDQLSQAMVGEERTKKSFLIEEGKINSNYYFIEKGMARFYLLNEGKQVTNWFFKEGEIAFSMAGVYYHMPAYGFIEMLEDAILYRVPAEKLNHLFETNIELCNFSRKLYQKNLFALEYRYFRLKETSAQERYERFCEEYPEILNRVGLGHIASYLGMSQVTLSRIRAQIE
ncbi:MAG: Crp/Fnr family transcriptional regulator [Bacteroidota bacterium]